MTRREAKALLATGGWRKDPEVTKVVGLESYFNDQGQSLVLLPGTRSGANLSDDRAAVLRYAQLVRATPPEHILEGRFPYDESFPAEVPRLIEQLATQTGLARSALDGTEESLVRVERAFSRKGGRRAFLTAEKFPAVVAYAGEVLRRRLGGGTWKMELSNGQWEPWFIGEDGGRYAVFARVHDGLQQRRVGAILGEIHGELTGHFFTRSSTRGKDSN